ncbi:MAG TPA: uracil-DNA glycosylase [Polyangia bacterium]|jgi:DNA polymerase
MVVEEGSLDPVDELGELAAQLRAHLEWQQRFGLRGVPTGPTPRTPAAAPDPAAAAAAPGALATIRADLGDCTRCGLAGGRQHLVYGAGSPTADLVFVGEAPGQEEDRQGEPFVGPAGQLLTKMIGAMGLGRDDVYICNIIKCRPPGNRDPEPDEVAACEPFLRRQLDAIKPRIIVALGRYAAQCLLRSTAPIGALRGHWHEYQGIPLMPTYHPAALLRNESYKRPAWDDLKQVMAEMDRLGLKRRR